MYDGRVTSPGLKQDVPFSYRFPSIGDKLKTFICLTLSTNFYKELVVVDIAERGIDKIDTHGQSSQSIDMVHSCHHISKWFEIYSVGGTVYSPNGALSRKMS